MPAHTPTDHLVPHISTIPANADSAVKLFVREYDGTKPSHTPQPVLMLHGRSVPVVAGFDLVLPRGPADLRPGTAGRRTWPTTATTCSSWTSRAAGARHVRRWTRRATPTRHNRRTS